MGLLNRWECLFSQPLSWWYNIFFFALISSLNLSNNEVKYPFLLFFRVINKKYSSGIPKDGSHHFSSRWNVLVLFGVSSPCLVHRSNWSPELSDPRFIYSCKMQKYFSLCLKLRHCWEMFIRAQFWPIAKRRCTRLAPSFRRSKTWLDDHSSRYH